MSAALKCMVCGRPCRREDSLCARGDCVSERRAVESYRVGIPYLGYRYLTMKCPYCPPGSQIQIPVRTPTSSKRAQEVLWQHIESHPERYT